MNALHSKTCYVLIENTEQVKITYSPLKLWKNKPKNLKIQLKNRRKQLKIESKNKSQTEVKHQTAIYFQKIFRCRNKK